MISAPDASCLTHQALLYSSDDELVAVALPFLQEGVRDRDVVMLVSSPRIINAVRDALGRDEARRIRFERSTERYTRAARALAGWQRLLRGHVRAGRRVRLVAEQPIDVLADEQVDELCRCDAAFNEVCWLPDVTVACVYDLRAASPAVLSAVRRAHPEVIEQGVRRPSPAYTEPCALLAEHLHGQPLPAPGGQVAELPRPHDVARARRFVRELARRGGVAEPALSEFVTAVNEVVTNAFAHAIPDRVRVWYEPGRVVCEVRDHGFGLSDPLAGYRYPESDRTSGWGLWLARQLTDLVEVRTGPGGSTFRLHIDAELPATA